MEHRRKAEGWKRGMLLWLVMVLCLFWSNGCALPESESGFQKETDSLTTQSASAQEEKEDGLTVHYIDVGQGDATLITCGTHAMLIDAGNNNMGTTVQLYLKKQGISHLDYVVGTHPDADHIGGLDVILYKFDWDTFFMPDIEKDTKTYEEVVASVAEKRAKITTPTAGAEYSLGEADFTILGPVNTEEKDANNSSIVIRLNYRDTHFLFNGDAEKEEEEEILSSGQDITADVYKVSHHGSAGANAADYVKKVQPQWAVISCGKNNSYGHPHKEVLSLLKKQEIQVFRTDLQGSVIAHSDGSTITFSSAVETPKEEKAGETEEGAEKGNPTYIINENTKKFHLPDCDSVSQIQKNNVRESDETKEELQKEGYTPCKRCQP